MALKAIAIDGDAILVADGEVGALITPRTYLVAMTGSLQGDWQPYDGPLPTVPQAALDEIAAMKRRVGFSD